MIRRNIGIRKNEKNNSENEINKNNLGTVGRNSILNGIDLEDEDNDDDNK